MTLLVLSMIVFLYISYILVTDCQEKRLIVEQLAVVEQWVHDEAIFCPMTIEAIERNN